jgi:hypothetical protein
MGGEIMNDIDGADWQDSIKTARTFCRTGSTRFEAASESDPEEPARKFVRQETMQTFDSERTWESEDWKSSRAPHEMTWQFFNDGLARRLIRLMFRQTLESPTRE